MLGFGCNPASFDGYVHELSVEVLIGVEPNYAIGIVAPMAIGVLHCQLGLSQAAKPLKYCSLADRGAPPGAELPADTFKGLIATDDLIAFLTKRDMEDGRPWIVIDHRLDGRSGCGSRCLRCCGGGRGIVEVPDRNRICAAVAVIDRKR